MKRSPICLVLFIPGSSVYTDDRTHNGDSCVIQEMSLAVILKAH